MNVYDLFVRHESDVVFLKGSGEEPVEPGHFPPKERHRMQLDLIMDVVERGLKDQGSEDHQVLSLTQFLSVCNAQC